MSWQHGTDDEVIEHLTSVMEAIENKTFFSEVIKDQGSLRANYLASVKLYHPNRVARRGESIRKMANEVFLAIQDIHDNDENGAIEEKESATKAQSITNPKLSAKEKMMRARAKARRSRGSQRGSKLEAKNKGMKVKYVSESKVIPHVESQKKPVISMSEAIEENFIKAKGDLNEGHYEQALLVFRQLSSNTRHDIRFKIYIYIAKAHLQLKKQNFDAAMREAKKAEELDVKHHVVQNLIEKIKKEKKRGGFFSRLLK